MVKFLLDLDSDAIIKHERAYGVFFSCDDQVASRKDQPATELLKMTPNTNYKGRELTYISVYLHDSYRVPRCKMHTIYHIRLQDITGKL